MVGVEGGAGGVGTRCAEVVEVDVARVAAVPGAEP